MFGVVSVDFVPLLEDGREVEGYVGSEGGARVEGEEEDEEKISCSSLREGYG